MGIQHTFPLPNDRAMIETLIEELIERLDQEDGDADGEETDSEDSFALSRIALGNEDGPGCPISDPGGRTPDEDCCNNLLGYAKGNGPGCTIADPDAAIDDGPCDTPHEDIEPEEVAHSSYGIDQRTAHPWQPTNDISARKPHLDRIRREQCVPTRWGSYRLISEPLQVVFKAPRRRRGKLSKQ